MENRAKDLVIAAEPIGPRVVSVRALDDYKLSLVFDNGEHRIFNAQKLLNYPPFAPLKNETFFRLAHVQYGTVCWPGDIDYCPDTLYRQSTLNEPC